MTKSIRERRRLRLAPIVAVPAVFAGLVLAGCSATHVGESWQCPLAQGSECASVAAADPAVPARIEGAAGRDLPVPLYRVRADGDEPGGQDTARTERSCDAACGPFAWLARLFGTDRPEAASPEAARPGADRSAVAEPPALVEDAVRPSAGPALPLPVEEDPVVPDPAGMETPVDAAGGDPAGEDLREAEVIGRIWIAPFVDAEGIYREGAYVRAVLAPAGWRLP